MAVTPYKNPVGAKKAVERAATMATYEAKKAQAAQSKTPGMNYIPEMVTKPAVSVVPTTPKVNTLPGGTVIAGNPVTAPQVQAAPFNTTRLPPTVPTPQNPIMTIGGVPPSQFEGMTDEDKMSSIALKKYKGEKLTDEEFKYLYKEQTKKIEDPYSGVKDVLDKQITSEEQRLADEEARLATERGGALGDFERAADARLAQDRAANQAAGQKQSQAVQGALSFSGFGRSTYNADKQGEIAKEVADRDNLLTMARNEEVRLYRARLEGADKETLNQISQGINDLKKQSSSLMLQSALKTAELNAENKVNSIAAIDNLVKTLGSQNVEIDENLSKLIDDGYLYRKDGTKVEVGGETIKTGVNKELNEQRKAAITAFQKFREELVKKGIPLHPTAGADVLADLQTSDDPQAVLDAYITLASQQEKVTGVYSPTKTKSKSTSLYQYDGKGGYKLVEGPAPVAPKKASSKKTKTTAPAADNPYAS